MTIDQQIHDVFKIYINHFRNELNCTMTDGAAWHFNETLHTMLQAKRCFDLEYDATKDPNKALKALESYIRATTDESRNNAIEQQEKGNAGTASHYQKLIKTLTALSSRIEHVKGGFYGTI